MLVRYRGINNKGVLDALEGFDDYFFCLKSHLITVAKSASAELQASNALHPLRAAAIGHQCDEGRGRQRLSCPISEGKKHCEIQYGKNTAKIKNTIVFRFFGGGWGSGKYAGKSY